MLNFYIQNNELIGVKDDIDLLSAILAGKFNIIFTLAMGYDIMKSV